VLKSLLTHAAAQLDRAAVQAATHLLTRSRTARLSHEDRVLALGKLAEVYDRPGLMEDPNTFFPRPSGVQMELSHAGTLGPLDVLELEFDVGYRTFLDEIRGKYQHPRSARGVARLYTPGGSGRPAAILIHGYLCGQWALEERLWPIQAMARWGLDVVVMVLPFHAVRSVPGHRGAPLFPSADPRFNVEGFRQAIMEVRALTAFLRERGAPHVGLMGMSLGGYTSALACTLDEYDFLVPMIPLSSLADFARDGGRLSENPTERAEQHRALDAVYRVVSPFSRPALVRGERALMITGEADRVTPSHHARRLADHFGARTHAFHGGHLLQLGRSNAFRAVGSLLERLGISTTPPGGATS